MMTLDEAIKHCEEVVEEKLYEFQECTAVHDMEDAMVCRKCGEEHEQLAEWLKELKQLREQTRWIPVSERLPVNGTCVLTTIKIPNRIARVRSGWYDSGFIHNDNGDVWKATDMEVLAWMPLPKPYKESEEE